MFYPYGCSDVRAVQHGHRVQSNIENLANIDYIASANNNNNILPGALRIYRLTVVANF